LDVDLVESSERVNWSVERPDDVALFTNSGGLDLIRPGSVGRKVPRCLRRRHT
jgi:hypothetical protein